MRRHICICLGLFLGTLLLFAGALGNDFVDYDDGLYVTENPVVQGGITFEGLKWAFTTTHAGNWHPLTWLSHMADVQMFGMNPLPHHAENVLLHALNAVLVFLLLHSLTGSVWPSALAAAFFAWHPLRVESVAWVAERKDVLSVCLGLLALLAYTKYTRTSNQRNFVLSILATALSLMAKPMLVTLPCVLLLLDVWPLKRWNPKGKQWPEFALLKEKVPFAMLALAAGVLTVRAQVAGGAVSSIQTVSFVDRIGHSLAGYLGYLRLTVWPMDLAVLYPLPAHPSWVLAGVGLIVIAGGLVMAWCQLGGRPWLMVGWCWFLGTLVPVIGVVQTGAQAMADRYTYFPGIGIGIMIAWTLGQWADCPGRVKAVSAAAAGVFLLYALIIQMQLSVWSNTVSLFLNTVEVTGPNPVARNNLGAACLKAGNPEEAVKHLLEALKDGTQSAQAHMNLALAFTELHRYSEAKDHLLTVLKTQPDFTQAHYLLGVALARDGQKVESQLHLLRAVELDGDAPAMQFKVAKVLARLGDIEGADTMLAAALFKATESPRNWLAVGAVRLEEARVSEAEAAWRKALTLEPNLTEALLRLSRLLATHSSMTADKRAEALELAKKARSIRPQGDPGPVNAVAVALAGQGRFSEAAATAREAAGMAEALGQRLLAEQFTIHAEQFAKGVPLTESRLDD